MTTFVKSMVHVSCPCTKVGLWYNRYELCGVHWAVGFFKTWDITSHQNYLNFLHRGHDYSTVCWENFNEICALLRAIVEIPLWLARIRRDMVFSMF